MAEINETLVLTELLSRVQEIKETVGEINVIAAAKIMSASILLEDDNPLLRDRMIGMAAILVAALSAIDTRETING